MQACPRRLLFASALLLSAPLVACGSRTGLLVSVALDAGSPPDATNARALPATRFLGDCFGSTLPPIYAYTRGVAPTLLAFDPRTAAFARLPTPRCTPALAAPLGIAVDRSESAYVLEANAAGKAVMERIALRTGACSTLSLAAAPADLPTGGLAFAEDSDGVGETLYAVTGNSGASRPSAFGLAAIDTTVPASNPIGPLASSTNAQSAPFLIGTGGGELFALFTDPAPPVIARVDRASGRTTAQWEIPGATGVISGFAFWGGDFYFFQWVGATEVLRFQPRDGALAVVARTSLAIGGATSSTCSPLR